MDTSFCVELNEPFSSVTLNLMHRCLFVFSSKLHSQVAMPAIQAYEMG